MGKEIHALDTREWESNLEFETRKMNLGRNPYGLLGC